MDKVIDLDAQLKSISKYTDKDNKKLLNRFLKRKDTIILITCLFDIIQEIKKEESLVSMEIIILSDPIDLEDSVSVNADFKFTSYGDAYSF